MMLIICVHFPNKLQYFQSWTYLITQEPTTCSPLRSCRSLNFSNSDGPFPCPDLIYKGSRIRLPYNFFFYNFIIIYIYMILLIRKQIYTTAWFSHSLSVFCASAVFTLNSNTHNEMLWATQIHVHYKLVTRSLVHTLP